MHVEGKFAEMIQGQGGAMPQEGEQPQAMPSQAPIQIESYSITGVDVTDQTIGPLSSAEVVDGRTFTSAETNAKVMLVEKGYAKQNDLAVGDTLQDRRRQVRDRRPRDVVEQRRPTSTSPSRARRRSPTRTASARST